MFNFRKHLNNDLIHKMFDLIDTNKDGQISEEELGSFLHFNEDQKDFLRELMDQADVQKHGVISFEEFRYALLR